MTIIVIYYCYYDGWLLNLLIRECSIVLTKLLIVEIVLLGVSDSIVMGKIFPCFSNYGIAQDSKLVTTHTYALKGVPVHMLSCSYACSYATNASLNSKVLGNSKVLAVCVT